MTKERIKKVCTGMLLCLAAAGLAGCGSGNEENTEGAVTGRLTSVSDTKIVMEVFDKAEGRGQRAASGSAAGFDGKRPEGTPPSDGKQPEGTPPSDGKQPDGTPPSDARQPKVSPSTDDGQKGGGRKKGETKTFQINSDTVIYKMSGDEKTEITIDEVDLGSMLSVVADDDIASSITVEDMKEFQRPGDREKKQDS